MRHFEVEDDDEDEEEDEDLDLDDEVHFFLKTFKRIPYFSRFEASFFMFLIKVTTKK